MAWTRKSRSAIISVHNRLMPIFFFLKWTGSLKPAATASNVQVAYEWLPNSIVRRRPETRPPARDIIWHLMLFPWFSNGLRKFFNIPCDMLVAFISWRFCFIDAIAYSLHWFRDAPAVYMPLHCHLMYSFINMSVSFLSRHFLYTYVAAFTLH